MKIFQKGFNYSQDGPGNRLVYHLQGCNFRCIWCSNPEGIGGACESTKEYTPEQIVKEAVRSKAMFFDGGGVTFTGGEATVQFEELKETLEMLKSVGINTALETNGSNRRLPELVQYVDCMMMDVKHVDCDAHMDFTGAGNETVLENFKILAGMCPLHVRIPLINGFNSKSGSEFAEFFSEFGCEKTDYEILPYHEYGKYKYKGDYKMRNGFVPEDDLKKFSDELIKSGMKVIRT